MERAHEKDGRQVFLITSCAENEGKSTVAANLALSLAQKHQRVLLLDADLRKPAQSLIFSASPAPGTDLGYLITHRPDREALEKAIVRDEATGLSHLYAAPLRRSQSEALSPDSFRPLLDALRESYSYILIDTPPFSFFADAEVLADAADAAILVVRQDLVPAAVVNDTIDDLNAAHAALLGCVLNNYQSFHFGSRLGGYGYGYGYGSYGGKYGYYGYGSKQGKEAAHGRNRRRKELTFPFSCTISRRTLQHFFWVPIVLGLLLGGVSWLRAARSYAPVYQSSAVFSVSAGFSSSTDILSHSTYLDSKRRRAALSHVPLCPAERSHAAAAPAGAGRSACSRQPVASSVADAALFTLTATGSEPQAVYDTLLAAIEVYPAAATTILATRRSRSLTSRSSRPLRPSTPTRLCRPASAAASSGWSSASSLWRCSP